MADKPNGATEAARPDPDVEDEGKPKPRTPAQKRGDAETVYTAEELIAGAQGFGSTEPAMAAALHDAEITEATREQAQDALDKYLAKPIGPQSDTDYADDDDQEEV